MIDYEHEHLIAIGQAPKYLPSRPDGKKVHRATVYRWAKYGLQGVRLETVKVGGARYTSSQALQRFIERITAKVTAGNNCPSVSSPDAAPSSVGYVDRLIGKILHGPSATKGAR